MLSVRTLLISLAILSFALLVYFSQYILFVSLLMLLVIILLPVLLNIIFINTLKIEVVEDKKEFQFEDESISIKLLLKTLPVPVSHLSFKISVYNEFDDSDICEKNFLVPLSPVFSLKKEVELNLNSKYSGKVNVKCSKIHCTDIIGMSVLSKRLKFATNYIVIPKMFDEVKAEKFQRETSDLSSSNLSFRNIDNYEIVGYHEYKPGDRLRDINFKLSARYDKMIVKEFEIYNEYKVGVLVLFNEKNLEISSRIIRDVMSINRVFMQKNEPYMIFYVKENNLCFYEVNNELDFFDCIRNLYSSQVAIFPTPSASVIQRLNGVKLSIISSYSEDKMKADYIELLSTHAASVMLLYEDKRKKTQESKNA